MKFYCPTSVYRYYKNDVRQIDHMKTIENEQVVEFEVLLCVIMDSHGRGKMKVDQFGTGYIYEADEYFQMYCMLKFGFNPVHITDDEYHILIRDKIYFFSKNRTLEIKEQLTRSEPINT
jgi:hypothetical protein